MFFYISFLRPPPLYSTPSRNILITPQIANDLRTEYFDGFEDIYYSWSQVQPVGLPSGAIGEQITKPLKLTTWRKANAYKEMHVPLPRGIRDGQQWRLILRVRFPDAGPEFSSTIDLSDPHLGRIPFPVISMPIMFTSGTSKRSAKQERIERVYQLLPRDSENDRPGVSLHLVEQTSFDIDKKIWDSGVGLSAWLVGLQEGSVDGGVVESLKGVLFGQGKRSVLELGAGIGIVGLTLAALRSNKSISQADVNDRIIATDLESAMPLLEQNISANKSHFPNTNFEAAILDWNEPLPPFTQQFPEGFDAVIMADVTYNTSSFPSLVHTLSQLVGIGTKPPAILLGYKERDMAERALWDLLKEVGIQLQRIGEKAGAGGAPVEVWLGRVERP